MPMPAKMLLRVMSGDLAGQAFALVGEMVIGRATTCTLFVPDRQSSREHAKLYYDGADLIVEDLGSHNGTYLNNERITREPVVAGDVIRIGGTHFAVEAGPGSGAHSAVRVISDANPLPPRMIRPVEPVSGPLDTKRMSAQDMFDALGVGLTERFDEVAGLPLLRKTRSFALLVEASKILQHYSNLRDTLPGLMDLVLQVVQGDRAAVMLLDEHGQLIPKVIQGRTDAGKLPASSAATPPEMEMVLSKTIADIVLKDHCAVITADAAADERFAAAESVVISRVRSLLVVPVLVGNRLLGLIEVENRRSVNAFDENDLHLVSVLGSMLGVALDHLEVSQARERAIAELRTAQQQLLATQQRLVASERMGVLGRISSGIAHEVKNHLSPFMLAEMIARKYPDDQEIQEASEMMLEAQQRILGIVDEIRTFASGSRSDVSVQPYDLAAIVESVLRFLRCDRVLRATDVRLFALARPIVQMDAARIRQVLINLIRNAADALENRQGHIDLIVRSDENSAVVEVRDNGPGIALDIRDRVFEPFFSTKGDKGLGLGLDISRQIVRAHGGALTFDSDLAVGTVFRMVLPLVSARDNPEGGYDDARTDSNPRVVPIDR